MRFESGHVILTPADGPQFAPDWRHQLARLWVTQPAIDMPLQLLDGDPYLEAQISHLSTAVLGLSMLEQTRPTVATRANNIQDQLGVGDLRQRLHAMLLTDATYAEIGQDLGLDRAVVRYFEQVFFNCRYSAGQERPHGGQLLWFALGGASRLLGYGKSRDHMVWRMVAATMGYTGLVLSWGMPNPARPIEDTRDMVTKCFDVGVGQMIAKYAGGQVQLMDVQSMFTHYVSYEKLQRENEKGHNEAAEALWGLIKALAPKLSEHANVKALGAAALERQMLTQVGSSNPEAQGAIAGQLIEDSGPVDPNELLNAQIKAHLQPIKPVKSEEPAKSDF